jgi:hypothetical protein
MIISTFLFPKEKWRKEKGRLGSCWVKFLSGLAKAHPLEFVYALRKGGEI